MHILINALHTKTGGGLSYLNHVLPQLARQSEHLTLLCQAGVEENLTVPANIKLRTVKPMGFWRSHVYEQLWLPVASRLWGVKVTWCNANYVPLLGVRPIMTIHTNPQVVAHTKGLAWKIYWSALRWLTRLSGWRSRRILTVADYLPPLYGLKNAAKVLVAPPGADLTIPKAKREENLLVAVGDIYVQKNYPLLLQAFARLKKDVPDLQLKIIGRAVEEPEHAKVKALIKKLKLQESVELTGPLPHKETLKWLAKAQVAALPSTVESYSMVMVEAMACGTPVVAVDVPCQRAAGQDAVAYVKLTQKNDAAAYGMAVYVLLTNPQLWKMFSQRGKEQVKGLTWAKTAQQVFQAILQAAGKKKC